MKQEQAVLMIDARGLNCPLPVLRLRKRLQALPVGATVELRATDRAALRDVPAFCESQGHSVTVTEDADRAFRFVVLKGDVPKV